MSDTILGIIGAIVLVVVGYFLYNTFFKPVTWTALYEHPNYTAVQVGGSFDSKEACQRWIYSQRNMNDKRYGFECGSSCEPPATVVGPYRCDKTVD